MTKTGIIVLALLPDVFYLTQIILGYVFLGLRKYKASIYLFGLAFLWIIPVGLFEPMAVASLYLKQTTITLGAMNINFLYYLYMILAVLFVSYPYIVLLIIKFRQAEEEEKEYLTYLFEGRMKGSWKHTFARLCWLPIVESLATILHLLSLTGFFLAIA